MSQFYLLRMLYFVSLSQRCNTLMSFSKKALPAGGGRQGEVSAPKKGGTYKRQQSDDS